MACSIVGKHKQKFIILKGTGGNGKGVLINLWKALLGDYYYKAPADILVDHKVDSRGPNPSLAQMAYKRMVMYSELPKRKKFNCSKIKLLSGDKNINARLCRKDNNFVIQYGLHICDCNFFPFMDEEDTQGNAIRRRLRVVHCESKFCDNPSPNEDDMEFKRDDYVGSQAFADKYKAMMMSMLIEIVKRTHGEVKDVKPVIKWTEDYYKKSSDIEEFFDTLIRQEPKDDIDFWYDMISFKDLYSNFRYSPIYATLNTYEKKKYNKAYLKKICMDRFKDRVLLGSRKSKFKNKSLESARKTKKYIHKFSGLVGYSFNDEDNDESSDEDDEDDEFISNNI